MSYIIITRREGRLSGKEHDASWSRCAVATLERIRALCDAFNARTENR